MLAALAWWQWPARVETAAIVRGPAVEAVYATGTVEPTVMIPLAPRSGGRLTAIQVAEGALGQDFEPRPSPKVCSWCDYRLICPASEA